MPLMNGNKAKRGTRSNTKLVKSGHASPAEEWLLDPRFTKEEGLKALFQNGLIKYEYGGPGLTDVIIPKGRVVGVATPVKEFMTGLFRTVITMPGLANNSNVIGMVPYNITKDYLQEDSLSGGNLAGIITQEYVSLPYMPGFTPSTLNKAGLIAEETEITIENQMPWGSVIGKTEVGDYVKATASGRLTKWIKGTDDACDIVGQILCMSQNQEEWGWLKWMLFNEAQIKEDDEYTNLLHNKSGTSSLPSDAGYPYDPAYEDGKNVLQHIHSSALHTPTGMKGLHDGTGNYDGFGRNDNIYKDIVLGTIPADGIVDGTIIKVQALDFAGGRLVNMQPGTVVVSINGVVVPNERVTVDHKAGKISIELLAADATKVDATKVVTATYQAYHNGTDSYVDFKGVHGLVNVLLKR